MGIDLFNYVSAWEVHKQEFEKGYPLTKVNFEQLDILTDDLPHLGTFDIIASDAVLEHVTDLDLMMVQLKALMRKNCIFYAGFGPLWYTWGGAIISLGMINCRLGTITYYSQRGSGWFMPEVLNRTTRMLRRVITG